MAGPSDRLRMERPRASSADLARTHYENFPVGSWLLPRRARRHLHRIYAFARTADDLADEARDAAALAELRESLHAHLEGHPARPVPLLADLACSVRELALPPALLFDLLDAFAQDLELRRHTRKSLLAYCRKSADPVGRLVLRVHGLADAALDELSDRICTALQIVNHLQDVRADYVERDRIYLPREDLLDAGVREHELGEPRASPALRAVVARWAEFAAAALRAGWPLTQRVRGRLRLELRAIVRGAAAVLRRLRAEGFDPLAGRVRLTRTERLRALLGAVRPGLPEELRGGVPAPDPRR